MRRETLFDDGSFKVEFDTEDEVVPFRVEVNGSVTENGAEFTWLDIEDASEVVKALKAKLKVLKEGRDK